MIDEDTIAEMLGSIPSVTNKQKKKQKQSDNWESQLIGGFKNNTSQGQTNKADPMNPKISGADLENVGNKLKDVPPFLIIGIVLLVIPSFYSSWGFLRIFGMICIVGAVLGKTIPAENKHRAKIRIKAYYAKWKLKRLEKQLEKEEKNG